MPDSLSRPPVAPLWLAVFSLGVATAAFLPTLGGGFLADDFVYVSRFFAYPWSDWPRLFTREWSEGVWGFPLIELRPVSALAFMVDARLWGAEAAGYRVTNLLLHLGVVWAVLRLTWRLSGGHTLGTLSAALAFALHPAHVEPVSWITGRVDLLATLAALVFWNLAEGWSAAGGRWRAGGALAALLAGVFAKELCLFAPPLLALRWISVDPRVGRHVWVRRGLLLAGVVAVALLYTAARRAAFGDGATVPASSWTSDDAWRRQASYAAWIAPVLPLLQQFELTSLPSADVLRAVGVGVAGLSLALLSLAAWKGNRRLGNLVFFTGIWWVGTIGGLLLVGYFSARHLYFPTTGLAVGFGLAVAAVRSSRGRFIAAGGLLWLGAAHVVAVRPWIENGLISRRLTATLQREVPRLAPDAIVIVDARELRRNVFLWFWACPQALGRPFLEPPLDPSRVLTRGGLYFRPEQWQKDIQPLDRCRSANGALVVDTTDTGQIRFTTLSAAELVKALPALAERANDGDGLHSPELSGWVDTVLRTHPATKRIP